MLIIRDILFYNKNIVLFLSYIKQKIMRYHLDQNKHMERLVYKYCTKKNIKNN